MFNIMATLLSANLLRLIDIYDLDVRNSRGYRRHCICNNVRVQYILESRGLLTTMVSARGQYCDTLPYNMFQRSEKICHTRVIPFPSPDDNAASSQFGPTSLSALSALALLRFWPRMMEGMDGGGESSSVRKDNSSNMLFPPC